MSPVIGVSANLKKIYAEMTGWVVIVLYLRVKESVKILKHQINKYKNLNIVGARHAVPLPR